MTKRVFQIVLLVALAVNAPAATRCVHSTIQKGIDHCQPGDSLFIPAGVYNEALVLKDGITLIGEAGETILDGAGLGTRLISCAADCQQPTVIEGLILQNARLAER